MIVESVAEYTKDKEIRDVVRKSDAIRREILRRCYNIDGYADLPLGEKNKIYDSIRAIVENEN